MMSFGNAAASANGYRVDITRDPDDIDEAQRFRAKRFGLARARDADGFDPACEHILIRDVGSNALVCCFRILPVCAADIPKSYAARHYDLTALRRFEGQMLELGRFCIDSGWRDPDVLRLAWATLTAVVDARQIKLLFGCSSFTGTDPVRYQDAFAYLREYARAPCNWGPKRRSCETVSFAGPAAAPPDRKRAFRQMPPLLRSYIGMGGWVSDHAVVDRTMNTLHVFTAVQTAAIPPARQRLLRALRDGPR